MFQLIPYSFYEPGTENFWIHFGLVIVAFILALGALIVQWSKPAPYGKHDRLNAKWGPKCHLRLGYIVIDALPGVLMFALIFIYSKEKADKGIINYIFFALFILHTFHRGIIYPLIMRFRNSKVALGIILAALLPNILYYWLNVNHICIAEYHRSYYYDPRFILGLLLYIIGFVINRWCDWQLRCLRKTKGSKGYYLPYGGLFDLVSCPNYFGELVQWLGWSLATWSLASLAWLCFVAATFFARSRHNHQWYKEHFEDYPANRKMLIPFFY